MSDGMKYCRECGAQIKENAEICPQCGCRQATQPQRTQGGSSYSRLVAILLAFFLGEFGAHRFYVGKIGTGILMLITLGGCGIWALVDIILIACGSFRDKDGLPLLDWQV